MTGSIGTICYMSPEMLMNKVKQETSFKTDVYSFGIIMHEVFFEKVPYLDSEDFDSIIALGSHVVKGLRPFIPDRSYSDAENAYIDLMQRCWSAKIAERPTFEEILREFELSIN